MVDLPVGTRLHAKYTDGVFYSAEVMRVSGPKKKSKARKADDPVSVEVWFVGQEGSDSTMWLPLSDLKSKLVPKEAAQADQVDLGKMAKGTKLKALADDWVWYEATVVSVTKSTPKKSALAHVSYTGMSSAYNQYLPADRLSLTAPKAKAKAKAKVKAKAKKAKVKDDEETQARSTEPRPAMHVVPILKRLARFGKARSETSKQEDAVAIVESSPKAEMVKMTYSKLLVAVRENSAKIAKLLVNIKDGAPKHVAYLLHPSIAYVVTELSIWAAGACCVPLSVHSPAPELEYFLEDSEAPLLIADASSTAILKPLAEKFSRRLVTMGPGSEPLTFTLTGDDLEAAMEGVEGDTNVVMSSSALILYTSGTTGKPKGALHTFTSLSAQYSSLSKAWKWSRKDYTLHVLPLHHIHGVQNILNTALYNGAGVEFTPFDAGFCLKRLSSGDMTCFHAVPTIYVKFTQYLEKVEAEEREAIHKGLRNDSLRYMVSGSAALPVPTMTAWAKISGHVLLERYGMTEIGMGLSNKITGTRYPGCVGWPLPFVKVKTDEDGSVLIKAPQVFKEYWKMPEATKKEFTEDGWFKTGDNVSCGSNPEEAKQLQNDAFAVEVATGRPKMDETKEPPGSLSKIYKILGRSSVDIIKSGGYKISALEIESVLLQHEAIKECAVIGKPDETWGEKVTAVCVLNGTLALKDLRDWGKERLATYKVPQELEVVEELPRNQMGKLEKKKLLDRYKKP